MKKSAEQLTREHKRSKKRKLLTVCLRVFCLIVVSGAIIKLLTFGHTSSPVIALAAIVVPQVVMPIVNIWYDIIWLRENW